MDKNFLDGFENMFDEMFPENNNYDAIEKKTYCFDGYLLNSDNEKSINNTLDDLVLQSKKMYVETVKDYLDKYGIIGNSKLEEIGESIKSLKYGKDKDENEDKNLCYIEIANIINNIASNSKGVFNSMSRALNKLGKNQFSIYKKIIENTAKYNSDDVLKNIGSYGKDISRLTSNEKIKAYDTLISAANEVKYMEIGKISNLIKFNMLYFSRDKLNMYVNLCETAIKTNNDPIYSIKKIFNELKKIKKEKKLSKYSTRTFKRIEKGKL